MIRLAVNGATGRMGQRVIALAELDDRFEIAAQFSHRSNAPSDVADLRVACDVVIDFSSDEGAQQAADVALASDAALLVGTTALSRKTLEKTGLCAHTVPVMIAPNTSRGVAVLNHLIVKAAQLLGSDYDVDLIDVHHHFKRDAPSGTALRLVDSLRRAGVEMDAKRVHSIRAGDVVGDHEVVFAGPGERVKISHFATSRDVFALGALQAAAWLVGQPAGHYTIEQSLGLQE